MSQRLIKLATSLRLKKYRDREKLFVAEGKKLVLSLLENNYALHSLLATEEWGHEYPKLDATILPSALLKKVSSQKTPAKVIGLFRIPKQNNTESFPALILEQIQNPGNLGTIIRTAAWFGFKNIYCSPDTADCYNPKVVQATMGALAMVNIQYLDLIPLIASFKNKGVCIYGTFLDGENIYHTQLSKESAIIIGNEGSGISKELTKLIDKSLTIPPSSSTHPESLNASISTAIICSEICKSM